jgi:peptidoglycan hydrolase-like protein with peptidoglycan-binding domain
MLSTSSKFAVASLLVASLPAVAAKPHTTHHGARMHKSLRTASHHEAEGMSSERATEIQSALIQHGYLSGSPSGVWDAQSSAAMAKLQAHNGWQTRITPDARALIKLGLGPQQQASVTTPKL